MLDKGWLIVLWEFERLGCVVGVVGKSLKKVFIEIMRLVCVEVSY